MQKHSPYTKKNDIMKYIIVFDPNSDDPSLLQDGETFNILEFDTLEEALEEAEGWKNDNSCETYSIYQKVL